MGGGRNISFTLPVFFPVGETLALAVGDADGLALAFGESTGDADAAGVVGCGSSSCAFAQKQELKNAKQTISRKPTVALRRCGVFLKPVMLSESETFLEGDAPSSP